MADKLLNLGLNDGTYCPQAVLDVLKSFDARTSLRNYTSPENDPLREAIARKDGVTPDHLYLANGSGPILKQTVPGFIRAQIKAAPSRIFKHVMFKEGYPIITPRLTYFKVPGKAMGLGLTVHLVPLEPEDGFKLDVTKLADVLKKTDGFVYLANPNNPTGNLIVERDEIEQLVVDFPRSTFYIDEAYVQYVPQARHTPVTDLVPQHDNMMVGRTFSFAYGMAALRIGYLVTQPEHVKQLQAQVVDYRLGELQQAAGIAAVNDAEHLPFIQKASAEAIAYLRDGLTNIDGVQTFPSTANFLLCRLTDGRSGADIKAALKERGILIKAFAPIGEHSWDDYFRLTIGTPDENERLLTELRAVLAA